MKNLATAIYTKASQSSTLWTAIGGRFYKNRADDDAAYPYVVYKLISDTPNPTFGEDIEDTEWQFSIFSAKESTTEIENLYTYLKAAFDGCSLTITGNTHLHMRRLFATLFEDELTNPNGSGWVWHYATDYEILMQKN